MTFHLQHDVDRMREEKKQIYTQSAIFFCHDGVSPYRSERKKKFSFIPSAFYVIVCTIVVSPAKKSEHTFHGQIEMLPKILNILDESPR